MCSIRNRGTGKRNAMYPKGKRMIAPKGVADLSRFLISGVSSTSTATATSMTMAMVTAQTTLLQGYGYSYTVTGIQLQLQLYSYGYGYGYPIAVSAAMAQRLAPQRATQPAGQPLAYVLAQPPRRRSIRCVTSVTTMPTERRRAAGKADEIL